MINLNKAIFNQIKNHSLIEKDNECCGLIVENKNKLIVYPCKNIANNTTINFKISYKDYVKAAELGEIKAYYHSHINDNDNFSELDKFNSYSHRLPLILYSIKLDEFKVFNGEKSKYIGKKFAWNEQDCLSLVEYFYKEEFDINLPHLNRNNMWFERNPKQIEEDYVTYGFKIVFDSLLDKNINLKYGDIIGTKYSKNKQEVSHLLIYVNNNQILHQRPNSYSTIEKYDGFFIKLTKKIFRHRNLC